MEELSEDVNRKAVPMEIYRMSAERLPDIHFVDDADVHSYIHRKRRAGEYIMYAIKRGEMHLAENGVPFTLKAGDICILDRDRTHVGTKASTVDYYYVHFQHPDCHLLEQQDEKKISAMLMQYRVDSLNGDIFSYDKCRGNVIYLPKLWNLGHAARRLRIEELLRKAKQENYSPFENYKVMCSCLVWQIFMEISRGFLDEIKESHSPGLPDDYGKINKITEWLNLKYSQEITGELLEEVFEYNYDYMNRMFKKVVGKTIFQYLTDIRINHARSLLLQTSMKMSEVGQRVGFPDEYYFNRVFKKHVGMPPAVYARSHQNIEVKKEI